MTRAHVQIILGGLFLLVWIYIYVKFNLTQYRRMRNLIKSDLSAVNFMLKYGKHRKYSNGISEKQHELLEDEAYRARCQGGKIFICMTVVTGPLWLFLADWLFKAGYIYK
jgi:hypothetical protein